MKRPVAAFLSPLSLALFLAGIALTAQPAPANADETISGFLFMKLGNIGTRSEGPQYFLQKWDYAEIAIAKKALLFQSDPKLQPLVGHKVKLTGSMLGDAFDYSTAVACDGTMECELPGR